MSFLGNSLDELRAFPSEARRQAGFQIERVQKGNEPNDWKPLKNVGKGVREIRVRDASGAFRVVYLASLGDTLYVLHAFVKKTQATLRSDIEIATVRFKQLMRGDRNE